MKQRQLLESIDRAFHGVVLGDGISLHETVIIDNYGSSEQRQAARQKDEQHDWHKLVADPDLVRICWVGGLSFYDAEGLRFHLPAYLSLAITDFEREEANDILSNLMDLLAAPSDEYNLNRLSILNEAQRRCIYNVLLFLREEHDLTNFELDQAISGYWSSMD